ncbi:hypothetical protein [Verminephrobacter eiseniae]|uniref:hypothetical protein n=1 Tax=Verminephrobacter eiseniae TaxID=364317 RepID=UPI0022372D5E|nr:hypothetical protein [Verminephrobacter eiseniae]
MNQIVTTCLRWLLRALLLIMGLVFFVSLLAAAMVLALAWALCALWARLTGRPMSPWGRFMGRVDPRTGFHAAFRSGARWTTPRRGGGLPGADEVTDVEPRDMR